MVCLALPRPVQPLSPLAAPSLSFLLPSKPTALGEQRKHSPILPDVLGQQTEVGQ